MLRAGLRMTSGERIAERANDGGGARASRGPLDAATEANSEAVASGARKSERYKPHSGSTAREAASFNRSYPNPGRGKPFRSSPSPPSPARLLIESYAKCGIYFAPPMFTGLPDRHR